MGDSKEKEDLQIIKPGNGLHDEVWGVSVGVRVEGCGRFPLMHLHQVGVGDIEPEQGRPGSWTASASTRKRAEWDLRASFPTR